MRRCQVSCIHISKSLPKFLYITLASTNRSLPEMEACTYSSLILISLYKFPPTRASAFVPEYMEKIMSMLLHWCDKEAPAFPTMATLLWLFAHDNNYREIIEGTVQFKQKMERIKEACKRKENMVRKQSEKRGSLFLSYYKDLPLPYLKPDWGFDYPNRPRVFLNSLQAFDCLNEMFS